MKKVLKHLPACREGQACIFQHCVLAKAIISMSRAAVRRLATREPIDLTSDTPCKEVAVKEAALEGAGQSNGISYTTPEPSDALGNDVVVPRNGTRANQNISSKKENGSIAINGIRNSAPKPRPKTNT